MKTGWVSALSGALVHREREELAERLRCGVSESVREGLAGVDLKGTDLRGVNLRGANLEGVNLAAANLAGANIRWANLEGADLEGAYLRRASFRGASFRGACLREADLTGANLSVADLERAKLEKAILVGVTLRGADLAEADLRNANLQGANLRGANLQGAALIGADIRYGMLVDTALDMGVAAAKLEEAYVDWRTIARSLRMNDLLGCLVRTGMPEVVAIYLIDSVRSIDEIDLFTMLQSVFLSYGGPDTEFADRLRNDLTRNGVKTWFFPKDAIPGARIHRHIQRRIHEYDRMILCCSEVSLQREGVLHEIEEVLEREQDEGGAEVMIPVLLDPIFDNGHAPPTWWPEEKEHIYLSLRRRVAADFQGATDNPDRWSEQLSRVLTALRKKPTPTKSG